ncbi:MAG: TetR/AcrR family transcriptional regulator [Myxococcales bacterium]|nr:TetR/AcrR family transcriptional regulator [Myxococcales bacterium]
MPNSDQARVREKRHRMLQAAQEVFVERGFDAAGTDEIARRAGVSKGTLYNFFDSKTDLLLSSVEAQLERSRALVEAALNESGDTPLKQLVAGIRALLLAVVPDRAGPEQLLLDQVWGIVARDSAARSRVFGLLQAFFRDREIELRVLLENGVKAGAVRSDIDAGEVTLLLFSIVHGLIYRARFDPGRIDPVRSFEALFDLLQGGLFTEGVRA